MKTSASNYVRIFDTSLRDGEQAPGASMTSAEKLEVARALARLGVDVIEAGFPAASPDDLAAVQAIAAEIGQTAIEGRPQSQPPIICGLARCTKNDIDAAWEGVNGEEGVRVVDASLGGIGGCPFAPNATGNVATEEAVALCDDLGVSTGLGVEALIDAALLVEGFIGHAVPSRVAHAGPRSRRQ